MNIELVLFLQKSGRHKLNNVTHLKYQQNTNVRHIKNMPSDSKR